MLFELTATQFFLWYIFWLAGFAATVHYIQQRIEIAGVQLSDARSALYVALIALLNLGLWFILLPFLMILLFAFNNNATQNQRT